MPTTPVPFPEGPPAGFLCPQCQAQIEANDLICSVCGTDLAWAAALAERQVLADVPPTAGVPYQADLLLPRFGEYLLRRGFITEAQLQQALTRQRAAALRGAQQTIGQTLFEMGAVTREQLDIASLEQVRQLQETLQANQRHMAQRLAEHTQNLQQALQKLSVLSDLKANLVSNFSHNLRSPMVPIRGYSAMLADERLGPLTPAQREALEVILRSVNQLETVVDEMGQLTVNLRGRVRVLPGVVALPDLAERLQTLFAARAASAGIQLRFDLPPSLPFMSADAEKLWWTLFQLFEQALKAMPAGGELTLAGAASGEQVQVAVHDTGPSLPPTQLDDVLHLPPEFISRLADSRGWSLAQIKRIVEAHGARLRVESRPELGTTVAFELPAVNLR